MLPLMVWSVQNFASCRYFLMCPLVQLLDSPPTPFSVSPFPFVHKTFLAFLLETVISIAGALTFSCGLLWTLIDFCLP